MPTPFVHVPPTLLEVSRTHCLITANERISSEYTDAIEAHLAQLYLSSDSDDSLYRTAAQDKDEVMGAWPTITCSSFSRFARDEYHANPSSTVDLLSDAQLLETSIKCAPDNLRHRVLQFIDAWTTVHDYDIDLGSELFQGARHAAFCHWMAQVQSACASKLAVQKIPDALIERAQLPSQPLLLIGFDEFTKPQARYFNWVAKHTGVQVLNGNGPGADVVTWSPQGANATSMSRKTGQDQRIDCITGCAHLREEIAEACEWARKVKLREPDATIGIVVPELARHYDLVQRQAGAILDPDNGSLSTVFDISGGKPLNEQPVWQPVSMLLRGLQDAWVQQDVLELVASPFVDLAHLAPVLSRWPDSLGYRVTPRALAQATGNMALMQIVDDVASTQRASAAQWLDKMQGWLSLLGWPRASELGSVQYQAMQRVRDTLARLRTLDAQLSFVGWVWLIDHQLRLQQFAPERLRADIRILGLLETSGLSFSHLWVCQLDETRFPSTRRTSAFLPLQARLKHGVPRSSQNQELLFSKRLLGQWLEQAGTVRASFTHTLDDATLQPSRLIRSLALQEQFSESAVAHPYFAAHAIQGVRLVQAIDQRGAALPHDDARGGTALMDKHAHCQFSTYGEYRLSLRETRNATDFPSPLERGSLIHYILQKLFDAFPNRGLIASLSDADIESTCRECTNEMYPNLPRAFIEHEIERTTQLAKRWVELEQHRDDFECRAVEVQHEVHLSPITINVRVDRIDTVGGKSIVIDYKTGRTSVPGTQLTPEPPPLTSTQLPIYSLVDDTIAGVFYGRLDAQAPSFAGVSQPDVALPRTKQVDDWAQLREQWRAQLSAIAQSYAEGHAEVRPGTHCNFCHLAALCRKAEIGSQ